MIDRATEEAAVSYALNLLEGSERDAFLARLEAEPTLRELVAELQETLHRSVEIAPTSEGPSAAVLGGLHQRIAGTIEPPKMSAKETRKIAFPWSWTWAAAALLLLSFNIRSVLRPAADLPGDALAAVEVDDVEAASSSTDPLATIGALRTQITRLEQDLQARETDLSERLNELQKIESNAHLVDQENEHWRDSYTRLAARFMPFFENREGLSRFTVIEMVDGRVADSQTSRRPFAELANQFLTGSDGISLNDPQQFMGPVVQGAGLPPGNSEIAGVGIAPISLSDLSQSLFQDATPTEAPDAAPLYGGDATGFTVWRDDEQKGFLDLYNLPEPGEGNEAVLWARTSDLDPYVMIGKLPELDNGNGSFFYSIDEADFAPTEILITAESTDAPGEMPATDRILLRGP